ncbi:non-ribosomal peptide synthetase [Microbispora triticiradicis]|uniref:Non-ribosomal peptide synthetase n=1 Tax=Microbispora triticiradicis TaxID=2200763 RepID=A0ABX9LRQ2_9ACTN|nr:non-ribosomal peptide synthetase [Microbispora triticiradicis]
MRCLFCSEASADLSGPKLFRWRLLAAVLPQPRIVNSGVTTLVEFGPTPYPAPKGVVRRAGPFLGSVSGSNGQHRHTVSGGAVIPSARLPLTPYQRDVWAAAAAAADSPQFNCLVQERLTGPVDLALLRSCLARAVAAHAAFRLRVGERDGTAHQWTEEGIPPIGVVDLSAEPDPRAACDAWAERSLGVALPLTGGPLAEITVLREAADAVHVVVKAHHIVADGFGLNLFVTGALDDYATGASAGISTPSYLDFAGTAAGYTGSAEHRNDLEFFRQALRDVSPALFTRKSTGGRARFVFAVEKDVVERLRRRGQPMFPFLAGVFAAYLGRVHRAGEVVLGIPLLNRRTGDEMRTVGHFANTLPLRVPVHAGQTMRALCADVQAAARDLQRHERAALGDVLRDLRRTGQEHRRLFDVTLSYLTLPRRTSVAGLSRETTGLVPVHDEDALAVSVVHFRGSDDVQVALDYATDVFDEDLPITAVAAHLQALLRQAADRPDDPLAELSLLGPHERDSWLRAASGPDVPYASDRPLHALVEERAARTPDRIAVLTADGGPPLTYRDLDERADRVARRLRAAGVGTGDRVAVLLERGPAMLVAILGVLKAGGAYVPVDPGHPRERIEFLLADCGAVVVLAAPGTTGLPAPVLRVDDAEDAPEDSAGPPVAGHDLAYVIYTSGSTGRPKGVMVEHHSVVNRLAWMQRAYPIGAGDVILQKTPISFDVSVWELFWWAIEGATVALLPPGGEKDPRAILHAIARQKVTVLHFVPSMLGPFLDLLESPGAVEETTSLRYVFCSGEALPPSRVTQFNRVFAARPGGAPRLVNLYGPTEATVDVSFHDCPADPGRPVDRVPIGRPIDNTRLYVLGERDEPQPDGVAGELCVGGVGVARGYLDRPELTAERFADDPFGPGRMYRTGDLARRLADGSLEYLGRIDDQVKIRGNRVELGEVRDRLSTAPGVRDAVVVDHTSEARGTFLVGYYAADAEIDHTVLRDHLARALPDYMIPAHLVRIDRVPLTPNGKTDRRALPAPPSPGQAARTAPRTPVEAALASIWARFLGVDDVGVDDDYFALGGDSLISLRIRAAAERLGIRFSVTDLLRNPTVAALAALTTTSEPADPEPEPFALLAEPYRRGDVVDAYPLTRLQLGLIYHSTTEERSAVYHDVFRYTFRLDWDEAAFRRAFDRLVARHPVLRSAFDLAGGDRPLQIVHPVVTGGLEVADLRGLPDEAAEAEVSAHVEERRYHPYDLTRAPLYLFRVHVRETTVEMVLSFHHALLDGGSMAGLLGELLQDYLDARGVGWGPVADDPLPSPATHVRDELRALASAEDRAYWRRTLDGAEPVDLDTLRGRGPTEPFVHRVDLPDDIGRRLADFARAHAVPVKSVLFAAQCLTLRLFSGAGDVTTGLIANGRPELPGGDRTAGLFVNTLPLRVDCGPESESGPRTWLDTVREAFRAERDGHRHRHYPLSAIQEDNGGGAVVETAFNYIHFHVLAPVLGHPAVDLLAVRTWEETNFKLLVNAVTEPLDGRVWLRLDCAGESVGAEWAPIFGRAYAGILGRILDHPGEEADLAFLAPPCPPVRTAGREEGSTVVARFAAQAARTPDAPAVVHSDRGDGERCWSYRDLDRTADVVARRLLGLGLPPGARIGIAMDRSAEMIAVILGTTRSGAACVPLDPGYPAERLAAMVRQASPFLVVAHEAHAHLVPDGTRVITVDDLLTDDGGHGVPPAVGPADTAYVLFTSGSTGRPKGVAMPHRALDNLVDWQNRRASGACGGRTLQYAPTSFDVSFQEIFSTLCSGGALHLVSEARRHDMPGLLRLLDREGIERIFMPYVALQQLAHASDALGLVPRSLKVVVSSGEQLRVTPEIRRFCARLPGVVLENQYGPTESHVVTSFTMSGDPESFPTLPPIGTAIDGATARVLDARLRPVPVGVKGEIYLGGVVLADGYIGSPELTAERFVRDASGTRLYRTGDLGYLLPSGDIAGTGRADDQVKVRGFRVEPAEVEHALAGLSLPGVREVAVVARRREADAFLAAFLVGDGERSDPREVRRRLRAVLPGYMVPTHVTWLDALPLTASGKRDDAALRRMPLDGPAPADTATPPRDALERDLAGLVAETLATPDLGVHDDIFDAGATSLTAMRLMVLIEQRYGTAVPMSDLIAAPTVAGLAERLRAGERGGFDPLVPLRIGGRRPPIYFVHPIGGNVLCYRPLAGHLPDDQPFHALQAPGTAPGTEPLTTIPDLARTYVEAIRRRQPRGPYVIGGWSFGGFVAVEMARQLRAAGERVERLVLLDTIALRPDAPRDVGDGTLLTFFFWELLWLDSGSDTPVEAIAERCGTQEEIFARVGELAERNGILPPGSSAAAVRRLYQVFQANYQAMLDYRPGLLDVDLTLLHAAEPLPDVLKPLHAAVDSMYDDPTNGWRALTTGRVEVVAVPGDHLQVVEEPYVKHVAAALAALTRPDQER